MAEIAQDALQVKNANAKEYAAAVSRVPNLNKAESDLVQWAAHNVPREAADPAGTFAANYVQMAASGKAPPVSEKTFNKMVKVVGELGAGWREGGEWRSAYGPAKETIAKIEANLTKAGEASAGMASRAWEETRKGGKAFFQSAENFRKWIASVGSRVQRADNIDKLVKMATERKDGLLKAARMAWSKGDRSAMRQLVSEAKMTNELVKDIKGYKSSPDFLSYLKKQESIPILKGYDKFLSTLKGLELTYNPAFYFHRFMDLAVVRSLAETGGIATGALMNAIKGAEPQPVRGLGGRLIEFGGHPSELLYDKAEHARGYLDRVVDAIDRSSLNYIGRFHYNQLAGEGLKAGMDEASAHNYAMRGAEKTVDLIHGIYKNRSAADHVFRRLFLYPNHYIGRMTYWATKAMNQPSEYYAAMRLRQLQQDHSVDRRGAYRVAGTNWGVDPIRRTTGAQFFDLLNNTDKMLTPEQNAQFRPAKYVQAMMGPYTPPLDWALKAAGTLPETPASGMISMENVLSAIAKNSLDQEIYPSDLFSKLLGKQPEESRKQWDDRRASMFMAAAKREGVDLPISQAQEMAKRASLVSELSAFATSDRLVPATPGFTSLTQDLDDARFRLVHANPESAEGIREIMLQMPKYHDLGPFLPQAPSVRLQAINRSLDAQEAAIQGEKSLRPPTPSEPLESPEQGKQEAVGNILDAFKHSKYASPFRAIYNMLATPAGAEEFSQTPAPPKETDKVTFSNGKPIVVPASDSLEDLQRADSSQRLLKTIFTEMSQLKSAEQVHNYINSHTDSSGASWLLPRLREGALVDANTQNYLNQYDYVASNGKQGDAINAPINISKKRDVFARDFKSWVSAGGPDAPVRKDVSLETFRGLVDKGYAKLTGGIKSGDIDQVDLDLAKQRLDGNAMYGIRRQWQDKQQELYPDTQHWVNHLRSAVYHNPEGTPQVVDAINDNIKAGKLDPKFWQSLNSDSKTRTLYEDASITDRYGEVQAVKNFISIRDQDGRLMGVSMPRVIDLVQKGGQPYLSVLASKAWGDPRFKQELADGAYRYGISLDQIAPESPEIMAESFLRDFNHRTGNAPNDFFPAQQPTPLKPQPTPDEFFTTRPTPLTPLQPGAYSSSNLPSQLFSTLNVGPNAMVERTRPWANVGDYVSNVFSQHEKDVQAAKAAGVDPPSLSSTAGSMLTYTRRTVDPSTGRETFQEAPALDAYQAARGINALAQISGHLAETNPDSDMGRALSGAQTSLATYGGLQSVGVPPVVSLPLAVGAGIYSSFLGRQRNPNADAIRLNQQRIDLERQRFQEQLRQQSIRDIRQRESDLTKAYNSLGPTYQNKTNEVITPKLLTFQRRPTFASRLGLVNAVEAQLGSALKPRW